MTTQLANIMQKYQGVAKPQVISAVANAADKTGVDFSFLMQKAQTESSFNPAAKAKGSSATGLFQFIEQTWLNTVKKYGDKYGLQEYADKIEIKDGKACVADCNAKAEILNLRKDPTISALMAGELTADNKDYLEDHTSCDVGATEMYMAHFMGAGGASKFLNCRDINGSANAAALFPQAAKANHNVFYDKAGKPRSLDQVYSLFDAKFSDGSDPSPSHTAAASPPSSLAATASDAAPASASIAARMLAMQNASGLQEQALPSYAGQGLPVFDDADKSDDIIWNDDPRFYGAGVPSPVRRLSPINIMVMSQMQDTLGNVKSAGHDSEQHRTPATRAASKAASFAYNS